MDELLEAFTIIRKYGNVPCPLAAEHDVIYVGAAVPYGEFSPEDIARLDELGFHINEEHGEGFYSFV